MWIWHLALALALLDWLIASFDAHC
jgi:hypothetical protein